MGGSSLQFFITKNFMHLASGVCMYFFHSVKIKVYFYVPKWIKVVVNLLENLQQLLTFWTRIQVFWCNLFCQILNTGFPLSPICIYPAEPHPVALHHFCMYISSAAEIFCFPRQQWGWKVECLVPRMMKLQPGIFSSETSVKRATWGSSGCKGFGKLNSDVKP